MTPSVSSILLCACPWEIFSVLVRVDRHNTIGGAKGLLNAISVMIIDVDIEYAGVLSKEF